MAKTPKASPEMLAALGQRLDTAAAGLEGVRSQKMFGCYALMARDTIFGLVWKEGRIGVKLRDASDYDTLMKEKGAAPWQAGPMTMASWVLVPPALAEAPAKLAKWVRVAHAQALAAPKTATKKKAAKKTTARKKTAKKATEAKPVATKKARAARARV